MSAELKEVTVLFHVRMDVSLPHDIDPNDRAELVRAEKERALELQKLGVWPHLWRVVGQYSNISVFDVPSDDELHAFCHRFRFGSTRGCR